MGSYLVLALMMPYGSAVIVGSLTEQHAAQRSGDLLHAFEAAEAGLDEALVQLRSNTQWGGVGPTSFSSMGTYQVTATTYGDAVQLVSTGVASNGSGAQRVLEMWVKMPSTLPDNFFGNAIYTSDTVVLKGKAYAVTGNVVTGDHDTIANAGRITGTITTGDASAHPLPSLQFQQLYDLAQSQGHVYTPARLSQIKKNTDSFPTQFCYSGSIATNDCAPNINYVTADLVLNGNIGTIGGFFVVVGNVLTDPEEEGADTTINGNGQIAGAIYTMGQFNLNGGGSGLNINGGVWAGDTVTFNGGGTISYDAGYQQAIDQIGMQTDVQVVSWRECDPTGCA